MALIAAAREPRAITAIVATDPPVDLVESHLADIHVPTLLLVSREECRLGERNERALRLLRAEKTLEYVPPDSAPADRRARVAHLAAAWFVAHLAPAEHVWLEEVGWAGGSA